MLGLLSLPGCSSQGLGFSHLGGWEDKASEFLGISGTPELIREASVDREGTGITPVQFV